MLFQMKDNSLWIGTITVTVFAFFMLGIIVLDIITWEGDDKKDQRPGDLLAAVDASSTGVALLRKKSTRRTKKTDKRVTILETPPDDDLSLEEEEDVLLAIVEEEDEYDTNDDEDLQLSSYQLSSLVRDETKESLC